MYYWVRSAGPGHCRTSGRTCANTSDRASPTRRSMRDSEPPNKEPVVQSLTHDTASPQLQRCPVCGVVGLPERIAIHACQDTTADTRSQTGQSTSDPTHSTSRTTTTASLQHCAEALQSITDVCTADICTDNPHVDHPILEIVSTPATHYVPPRVLSILATYHCGLCGLHTRQAPQSWVLEAIAPTTEPASISPTAPPSR